MIKNSKLPDIKAEAFIYEHVKTGARLIHIENDDDNKVFSIAFATPPENSTGVAHILEHSVLCGSQKYPVKEPFVELMKGSLNTFLNAMTYPDKTMYPVASQNDKDFDNLMDVYLDSVFFPDIYESKEIFLQEGWHHEIDDGGKASVTGVVYNEMKGAYSSPENYLFRHIQKELFPETAYGHDSGGDPDDIPDLSWQQFLDFHKTNYQPSNSYIFLYGKLDIDEKLSHLDSYLSRFERRDTVNSIVSQNGFDSQRKVSLTYAVSEDENRDDMGFMALNWAMPVDLSTVELLAMSILEYMLLETNGSPLKEVLVKGGMGKDVYGHFEDEILQPFFTLVVKDIDSNQAEGFNTLVTDTLTRLSREGLSEKLIASAINKREFSVREADFRGYPKGLVYNSMLLSKWLYGEDPFDWFHYDTLFTELREAAGKGLFESLIERYLLTNNHSVFIVMTPENGLQQKQEKEREAKLAKWVSSLSPSEVKAVKRASEKLLARQSEPDSPEVLQSIPILTMDDLEKKSKVLPIEKLEVQNSVFLKHTVDSSGIVYFRMLFDASSVTTEEIPYLSLLEKLMGSLSTEHYTYEDLSHEVNLHLGGLGQSVDVMVHHGEKNDFETRFSFRGKSLYAKLPQMFSLIREIAFTSKFSDYDRLKEMISLIRSRVEMMIMQSGHILGFRRILSQVSDASAYREYLSGIEFYRFIRDLEENFDQQKESLSAALVKLQHKIFTKSNLITSFGAEELFMKEGLVQTSDFIASLPESTASPAVMTFPENVRSESFSIPGQVQYVIQGGDFIESGYQFNGSMMVARQIFSSDYLWNDVRVKGGAYGAFARFTRSGGLLLGSYRDPRLAETLAVYKGLPAWIRAQSFSDREILKYIIGTIGDQDAPMTPSVTVEEALTQYISGFTQDEIQKERDDILSVTSADIIGMADLIEDVLKQNRICVVGNESTIRAEKELFDSSSTLL